MGCKLAEWEGDSCCGSGHYGMSLKEESAEEERREHTMFPCNAELLVYTRAGFQVQGLVLWE